jgi:hypothetical protein
MPVCPECLPVEYTMSRRALIIVVSLALVLVVALVAAGPVAAKSSKAKEKAEHARILKYWTPKRMKNAVPRDFVMTKRGVVPAKKGGGSSRPDKPGGGGGGSTPTVTGASWNDGGAGLDWTGKVYFTLGSTNYVCSASTVYDGKSSISMVLTAGHCTYDETNGGFAKKFMYVPGYDAVAPINCFSTPGSCFTAQALVLRNEFATAGGFNEQAIQHDWAFAVFDNGVNGGSLDGSKGNKAFGIDIALNARDTVQSFGYPAAGKYGGQDLIYCLGPVAADANYNTWGLACDMTGGASGGGWVGGYTANGGTLKSVNSYKYNGGPLKDYMFGPTFNDQTTATYTAALTATGNTLVKN